MARSLLQTYSVSFEGERLVEVTDERVTDEDVIDEDVTDKDLTDKDERSNQPLTATSSAPSERRIIDVNGFPHKNLRRLRRRI
jgi:hypothetical protein